MCDSSFTVEKKTFVADIKQSITKVTKGISDYVKEKTGAAEDEGARIFMEIKGKKYDRELIETAQELTEKEEEIKLEDRQVAATADRKPLGYALQDTQKHS